MRTMFAKFINRVVSECNVFRSCIDKVAWLSNVNCSDQIVRNFNIMGYGITIVYFAGADTLNRPYITHPFELNVFSHIKPAAPMRT